MPATWRPSHPETERSAERSGGQVACTTQLREATETAIDKLLGQIAGSATKFPFRGNMVVNLDIQHRLKGIVYVE